MPASSSSLALPTLVDLPTGLLPAQAECTPADQESLVVEMATVIDGRCPQGLRHPLLPILVLAVWAVMGAATSFTAITEAAQDAGADLVEVIGLRSPRWGLPSLSTIRRALTKVDVASFEAALRRWATRRAARRAAERAAADRPRSWSAPLLPGVSSVFALDGKVATVLSPRAGR